MSPAPVNALRRVGELLGVDDPQSQAMQLGAPTPLVSLFKDKAARVASTNTFRNAARALPNRLIDALDEFAGKYPRVAAHMRPIPAGPFESAPSTAAWVATPYKGTPLATQPRTVSFTPVGRASVTVSEDPMLGLARARKQVFHEGTHVAQGLGNKDFGRLYDLTNDLVGYEKNPFEVVARYEGGASMPRPQNAIKVLKEHALQAEQSFSEEEFRAASKILRILEERANTPLAPTPKPPRLHPKPKQ